MQAKNPILRFSGFLMQNVIFLCVCIYTRRSSPGISRQCTYRTLPHLRSAYRPDNWLRIQCHCWNWTHINSTSQQVHIRYENHLLNIHVAWSYHLYFFVDDEQQDLESSIVGLVKGLFVQEYQFLDSIVRSGDNDNVCAPCRSYRHKNPFGLLGCMVERYASHEIFKRLSNHIQSHERRSRKRPRRLGYSRRHSK